ncbi:PREDICTED: uncharacterized protein LOC106786900 [Polistes canadensis]|uniref:uncharacterized protein LOC106786900 n=1 Tax=Polistes canadensis TaxID=91411 RepID=UPI000718F2ED|nr:PREDICTED: uncharacterized protein LOC106786900 [Polistes canadensis]
MTSEEECPCTDTSEPSNLTSLRTDISSMINSYESYEKINKEENKSIEESHQKPVINQESQEITNHREIRQCEPVIPCYCHAQRISGCILPAKYTKDDRRRRRSFWSRFRCKWSYKKYLHDRSRSYENKLQRGNTFYEKPSSKITNDHPKMKIEERMKFQGDKFQDKRKNLVERIDIYYFDHGNSAYYRTTDSPPILMTEKCAEKTDQAATRFWAEIFGTIHIGTAFLTAFILQFIRFILFSLIRPLTVGILQLFADYFMKPLLSIIFNALIQPILILLYNIATSIKDLSEPLAEAIGLFLREIANLCRSIRIIEIKYDNKSSPT